MTLRLVLADNSLATPLSRNSRKSAHPASPFGAFSSCCSIEQVGSPGVAQNLKKIVGAPSLCTGGPMIRSDANAPAFALPAQGTVARCRLASFVASGKDDVVAKIFRQIEGAQARRR
jgi:hypothetical protein